MHHLQRVVVRDQVAKYKSTTYKRVHDIGSYDVNGTHRPDMVALGLEYVGYDMTAGPNVDVIVSPYDWSGIPSGSCDVMIAGSCLEHVEAPWLWAQQAFDKVRVGGLLVVETPYDLGEHRYPVDCFRYLPDGFRYLFTQWVKFTCLECAFIEGHGSKDTYFTGLKA